MRIVRSGDSTGSQRRLKPIQVRTFCRSAELKLHTFRVSSIQTCGLANGDGRQ